ncbi:hypothetical protein L7F22_015414 [Adiantum nelumboides]|nr:hypothetical protein [Adiantum nelumboides]
MAVAENHGPNPLPALQVVEMTGPPIPLLSFHRGEIDKEQDSQESALEDVPREVEAVVPSEYKRSDEEDTSTPLEKKSQKPRAREQVLMDEAMARVEARRKELADARAAKAAKKTREKYTAEQRAAQLAREKIKEALSRKAEEPVLEPTQGSLKRPRQEEEEEYEHIQADPIPPSPINIPPAPPSSPITPFPPASTPQTPPSPSPLDITKSPPAPTSPQQQPFSAEPFEIPTPLPEETAQPMDKTEGEMQKESEPHKPADIDLSIPIMQLDEPTNEEAIQESQLTRKETQNHELIKNEKKMKEQLKYEDARFQKLTASYNTVKNTLTTLLQNQEPTAATPSTSDSAAANTLAALQEELQTERLQRQLLVSGFMSQTTQHEAKVKQLELELAKAKANLEAVGSLASTSQIQAETHLPIQQPLMPEMPKFHILEEEEQPRPAPGALDIREQMEQEIEDMPEGPAKEYLLFEKKVTVSVALAFLQSEEQIKDFGSDFLPLPLMRHEANL